MDVSTSMSLGDKRLTANGHIRDAFSVQLFGKDHKNLNNDSGTNVHGDNS